MLVKKAVSLKGNGLNEKVDALRIALRFLKKVSIFR